MRTNTLIVSCVFLSFSTIFVLPLLMRGVVSSSDNSVSFVQQEEQSVLLASDIQRREGQSTTVLNTMPGEWHSLVGVVDGDTIDVMVDGFVRSVRLIGIDTPEIANAYSFENECFGPEAQERLEYLLEEHEYVFLMSDPSQGDTDIHDRLLRYVYVWHEGEWVNVNFLLVYDGYAYEYTYYQNPYPYQWQSYFRLAEHYARYWGRGLWSVCHCPQKILCS